MRSTPLTRTLTIIALLQILGGVAGAVMTAMILPRIAAQSHLSAVQLLPWFAPPFVLSLAAGTLLWRGGDLGEILSLVNLALQIPVLGTPFLSYFFNAGLALRVWISSDGPGAFVFLGSQFHIDFAPQASGVLIGVNVVAVILLVLLIRAIPDTPAVATAESDAAHSA